MEDPRLSTNSLRVGSAKLNQGNRRRCGHRSPVTTSHDPCAKWTALRPVTDDKASVENDPSRQRNARRPAQQRSDRGDDHETAAPTACSPGDDRRSRRLGSHWKVSARRCGVLAIRLTRRLACYYRLRAAGEVGLVLPMTDIRPRSRASSGPLQNPLD